VSSAAGFVIGSPTLGGHMPTQVRRQPEPIRNCGSTPVHSGRQGGAQGAHAVNCMRVSVFNRCAWPTQHTDSRPVFQYGILQ